MYAVNTSGTTNNIDGRKIVHRRANRRLMIGALAVLVLAVIAAIVGVIIFLSRQEDTPKSTTKQFSPVFDIQFSLNETWDPNYDNPNSVEFQQLSTKIRNELDSVFRDAMNNAGEQYNYTDIISFSNGSIVTKCRTYWKRNIHIQTNKNTITTTTIDEVLVYQTLFDGFQKAEEDPVPFSLLSKVIDGSISVNKVDAESSTVKTTLGTPTSQVTSTPNPTRMTTTYASPESSTTTQAKQTTKTTKLMTTTTQTTTQTTETTTAAERVQGINLPDHNVMIRYTLDQNQGMYFTDFMNISVKFNTMYEHGFLVWVKEEDSSDHVSMDINNRGGVRFIALSRFERIEVNSPVPFSYIDGQEHFARMWRTGNNGNIVHLQVDNGQEAVLSLGQSTTISNTILTKPKYMYIGKNETTQYGFKGCISNIVIDGIDALMEIYKDPRPSFIEITPNNTILRNDMCGYDDIQVDASEKITGGVCQNETIIVQHAIPCLAQYISSALVANNQTEFCSVLENVADCIIQKIKDDTNVQCTEDDKYKAVKDHQSDLNQVFVVYGIPYKVEPCIPS